MIHSRSPALLITALQEWTDIPVNIVLLSWQVWLCFFHWRTLRCTKLLGISRVLYLNLLSLVHCITEGVNEEFSTGISIVTVMESLFFWLGMSVIQQRYSRKSKFQTGLFVPCVVLKATSRFSVCIISTIEHKNCHSDLEKNLCVS